MFSAGPFDGATEPNLREILSAGVSVGSTGSGVGRARGPLRRVTSGSYHLPDPIDWGDLPGREPPSPLLMGLPLAPPGMPETPPDACGPLWLSQVRLRPAHPLLWPNNPTGGPILELDLIAPDSAAAVSGVRLTTGSSDTHTEEFVLVKPRGSGLASILYGDHKTAGRLLYLDEKGQNLLFRYEHGTAWGGWSMGWQGQFARAKLIGSRRWLWDRSGFDAGAVWTARGWEVQSKAAVTWHRLAWEGSAPPSKRKDEVKQVFLRATGPGGRVRPRVTVEYDHDRLRFFQPEVLSLDRRHHGLGLAAGVVAASKRWRLDASGGRSSPGSGRSGWVACLEAEGDLDPAWRLSFYLGRSVRPPLVPRLANHLSSLVGQGLTVPRVDPDAPLEALVVSEASLRRAREGGVSAGVRARWVRIENTISTEGGLQNLLTPEGLAFLPPEAFGRTIQVRSLHAELEIPLGFGFRLGGEGAARASDPGWRDQFWMTPWDARGELSSRIHLFQDHLRLETFLRATVSGRRATPFGILSGRDRYDGGVSAEIASFRLFFLLANLEDDLAEAAAYDGGWMIEPRRSYRMGLTWRFVE